MSKAFRLGAFIVGTLLIFAAGVFWIGGKEFLFASTYRLNAEFPNVAGLGDGAEVRVGGIHEGTVRRIDLPRRTHEKVRVVMDLKGPTRDVVKKDSVAAIRSEGLVGDKYVEISFGSDPAPKVNSGDTIQSELPLDISDLVKKTNSLLDSAQGAMQNVDDTVGNLKSISSKINQGTGTVGALVNDKKIYQNVNAGAAAFQEDMEALKHNFFLRGFFNKRGYEDSTDLSKHEISQLPAKPVDRKFTYDAGKIFERPDTAKLKNGKPLKDAGEFLQSNPPGLVVVAASTDMKGDTEKDRLLTQARAMVVRDYLVQNFKCDDTRIKTIGLGKSAETSDGGRVEILIYSAGADSSTRASQPALSTGREGRSSSRPVPE
jgi:phospholipid/cholesterol/gamma-HCH transport system substrate-binding protein